MEFEVEGSKAAVMGQDDCPIQNPGPAWSIDQPISKWSANKAVLTRCELVHVENDGISNWSRANRFQMNLQELN